MTAVNFLMTETARKSLQKELRYQDKLKARKASQLNVTPENQAFIWNHLGQALFSIDYASFHIKALNRLNAFPDTDAIMEFAKNTETKFNTFLKHLNEEGKIRYRKERTEYEEFARQFATFNDEERKRIYGMANKIEKERFR